MMAVVSGLVLVLAIIFSLKDGVMIKWFAHRRLSRRILGEDILALLYRESEERGIDSPGLTQRVIAEKLQETSKQVASAAMELVGRGYLEVADGNWTLTMDGHRVAQNLVRSHRQWEQFLSVEAGISDPRLHAQAESLEHYTDRHMRGELDRIIGSSSTDPHGKHIPPESS
jgi:manganese/zinc/iron transport system permease protein